MLLCVVNAMMCICIRSVSFVVFFYFFIRSLSFQYVSIILFDWFSKSMCVYACGCVCENLFVQFCLFSTQINFWLRSLYGNHTHIYVYINFKECCAFFSFVTKKNCIKMINSPISSYSEYICRFSMKFQYSVKFSMLPLIASRNVLGFIWGRFY